MIKEKIEHKQIAALIDKRPMPDQQWQISVTFADNALHWKTELDNFIKAIPQEQRNTTHLEARIISFLLHNGFAPISRDFFVKTN